MSEVSEVTKRKEVRDGLVSLKTKASEAMDLLYKLKQKVREMNAGLIQVDGLDSKLGSLDLWRKGPDMERPDSVDLANLAYHSLKVFDFGTDALNQLGQEGAQVKPAKPEVVRVIGAEEPEGEGVRL